MGKTERFSLTFTVNNFSKVKKELFSPPVIGHNLKWRIKINPTCDEKGQQTKSLGYFLICDGPDGGSSASSWSCQATANLEVYAVKPGAANHSEKFSRLFDSKDYQEWGYESYMPLEDVKNTQGGLIEDDSVTFLVLVAADEPKLCKRCEERTCKVCMKNEGCILFDPCGHLATCIKCSSELNECPICRGKINKKIRAFV